MSVVVPASAGVPGQPCLPVEPAAPAARRSLQGRVTWGSRVVTVGGGGTLVTSVGPPRSLSSSRRTPATIVPCAPDPRDVCTPTT
jgi:hypothetical protein